MHVLREARRRSGISVIYSAISRIELLGFPNLTEHEEAAIRRLLNEFEEVAITNAVVERTIQIRKSVRVKIPDALIAASAETAQAILVTRNAGDFQRISGLTVVHPDNV
jgi:predicted nucleic acid-binding protein